MSFTLLDTGAKLNFGDNWMLQVLVPPSLTSQHVSNLYLD